MRAMLTQLFPGVLFKVRKGSKDTYTLDAFVGRRSGTGKAYACTRSRKHGIKTSAFIATKRVAVVGLDPDVNYSRYRGNPMFSRIAKLGASA